MVKGRTSADDRDPLLLALFAFPVMADPSIQVAFSPHGGSTERGVEVEVVLDKSNEAARFSEAGAVAAGGIPVRVDYQYRIMHDKFIIVDGVTVETGSFNFSSGAETSNAENLVVIRGEPDVAQQYEQNWSGLWAESQPYQPKGRQP